MRRVLFFSLCTAFLAVSVTSCNKDDDYFDAEILEGIDEQGAIVGKFSIAANRQVQFSRGNLQYQASTDTWKFADHQYDVVGNGNLKRSATYSGWIDLFVRGTSGCDHLLPQYASSRYYNEDSVFYSEGYNNHWYFILKDISETPYDWGSNVISNGGNAENLWRTLTKKEWHYLLFDREKAKELLGLAVIDKKHYGLIILPDGWTTPDGLHFTSIDMYLSDVGDYTVNKKRNNVTEETSLYKDNIFTRSEWIKMQQNGAVFLPITGYTTEWPEGYEPNNEADGLDISWIGCGFYWTSSYYRDESGYNNHFPYYIRFEYGAIVIVGSSDLLCAVRLAKDVK